MTDKQIKELAQSYVDELFAHDDMQDQENIENKNDALVMCMAFAGHILEKHCIVPKSQVIMAHKIEMQAFELTAEPSVAHIFKGRALLIEALFGKELFNN